MFRPDNLFVKIFGSVSNQEPLQCATEALPETRAVCGIPILRLLLGCGLDKGMSVDRVPGKCMWGTNGATLWEAWHGGGMLCGAMPHAANPAPTLR